MPRPKNIEEAKAIGMRPFDSKTGREHGKLAKGSKSPNRNIAQKLRRMREKGLTDESSNRLFEMMTDGDISSLDLLVFFESLKNKDDVNKLGLGKALLEWHKVRHGSKEQPLVGIQINQLTIDEKNAEIKRLLGKKK